MAPGAHFQVQPRGNLGGSFQDQCGPLSSPSLCELSRPCAPALAFIQLCMVLLAPDDHRVTNSRVVTAARDKRWASDTSGSQPGAFLDRQPQGTFAMSGDTFWSSHWEQSAAGISPQRPGWLQTLYNAEDTPPELSGPEHQQGQGGETLATMVLTKLITCCLLVEYGLLGSQCPGRSL